MGKRGPHATKIVNITEEKATRPNPPPGMSPNARTVWWRIVCDFEPGHFRPRHYDLLRAFCEAAASHKSAVSELEKGEKVVLNKQTGIAKRNPLYSIIDAEVGRMAQLSTKLGLQVGAADTYARPEKKSRRDGLLFGSPGFQVYGGGEK